MKFEIEWISQDIGNEILFIIAMRAKVRILSFSSNDKRFRIFFLSVFIESKIFLRFSTPTKSARATN